MQHDHSHDDEFERGFAFDVHTMSRRRALVFLGGAGASALTLAACASTSSSSTPSSSSVSTGGAATSTPVTTAGASSTSTSVAGTSASTTVGTTAATVATVTEEIPDETAGPYPGDGSNGPNVLTESGVVRSDITASVGGAGGVADGIPLTFTLALVDVASRSALAGAAVYAWHCDAAGLYSMYSEGVTDENYLRGVLEADANGLVTFQSIVPGCYRGRWPHIHFEVYESLGAATSGANAIKVSQLALPQAVCEATYADNRYPGSTQNLGELSLASDNVFADDQAAQQLAVVAGSNDAGYVATLPVGI